MHLHLCYWHRPYKVCRMILVMTCLQNKGTRWIRLPFFADPLSRVKPYLRAFTPVLWDNLFDLSGCKWWPIDTLDALKCKVWTGLWTRKAVLYKVTSTFNPGRPSVVMRQQFLLHFLKIFTFFLLHFCHLNISIKYHCLVS